ncbi:MAG TPA: phage baseplate assembly protein V [Acidimicrobiales bacterium]
MLNNIDPQGMGRVQVAVPVIQRRGSSAWALPCVPIAGAQAGIYLVPPVGASVWVEFEEGDPDQPIWVGGFWASGADVPPEAGAGVPGSPSIVLRTTAQNAVVISDLPGPAGGIMLRSTTGATILVNDAGISISNGKGASITMSGPTVSINNGALVVD